MKPALSLVLLLAPLVLLPRHARASVEYPAEVKKFYDVQTLPATPPSCTLCHRDNNGGADTVVRPFGRALVRLGAVKNSVPSLTSALEQIEQSDQDSDGDGVGDAEELRSGGDPNVGTGETEDPLANVPFPETGCALAGRPARGRFLEVLALVSAALLITLRRRI